MKILELQLSTYRRKGENGRALYISGTLLGKTVWVQRWAKDGGQPDGKACPLNREFTWKAGAR